MFKFCSPLAIIVTFLFIGSSSFALSSTIMEYNKEYEMVLITNKKMQIEVGDLVKVSDQCVIEIIGVEANKAVATTDLCISKNDITVNNTVSIEKMNEFINPVPENNQAQESTTAQTMLPSVDNNKVISKVTQDKEPQKVNKKANTTVTKNQGHNKSSKLKIVKNNSAVKVIAKSSNKSGSESNLPVVNLDPAEKFDFSKYRIRALKKASMPVLSKPVLSTMSTKQKIVYIEKPNQNRSTFKTGYYFTTHVAAHTSDQEYQINNSTTAIQNADGYSASLGISLGYQKLKQNQFGYKLSGTLTNSNQSSSALQTVDLFASANVGIQKNIYLFAGGHASQILSSDLKIGTPIGYGMQAGVGYQSKLSGNSILQNFMVELNYLTTEFNSDTQLINGVKITEIQLHLGVPF